jgi:hypothetical protein
MLGGKINAQSKRHAATGNHRSSAVGKFEPASDNMRPARGNSLKDVGREDNAKEKYPTMAGTQFQRHPKTPAILF